MKILQVAHSFPPFTTAGTEIYTYNLSCELARRHNLFVFHRINDLEKEEYALEHYSLDGFKACTINNTFRKYKSFEATYKNDAVAEKFGFILDQIKPDIVHVQHLLYLSTRIVEEMEKRNIPIVFTLHDYWLICPQGQLLKNNMKICNGENNSECMQCIAHQLNIKKNVFNTYYFLKKIMPEALFQLIKNIYLTYGKFSLNKKINLIEERITYIKGICSRVDLFISPSQFLRKKFIEFGIPQNKIIFSRYGFNLDSFKDVKKQPSAKLRFGFIGNLLPAKGVHVLINAFNKIKDDKAELRIYGEEISYKGKLGCYLSSIKKLAKNKNIKFMGGFDNRNAVNVFNEIDVLIVPSIWYENSPLVIQEAFACKTAVIASRTGGILELIEDGRNGFLFEPNNADDLYRKINLIIKNHCSIEEIKQNIKPPKSIEENAQELGNIYEDLLKDVKTF